MLYAQVFFQKDTKVNSDCLQEESGFTLCMYYYFNNKGENFFNALDISWRRKVMTSASNFKNIFSIYMELLKHIIVKQNQ